MTISIKTNFLIENSYTVKCDNIPESGMKLALRIPDYAKDYQIMVSGEEVLYSIEKGYGILSLTWMKEEI